VVAFEEWGSAALASFGPLSGMAPAFGCEGIFAGAPLEKGMRQ